MTNLPAKIGTPQIMPGTERPAINAMPKGAPINVPICQSNFFLRVHGFFPQNVQPVGLYKTNLKTNYKKVFVPNFFFK